MELESLVDDDVRLITAYGEYQGTHPFPGTVVNGKSKKPILTSISFTSHPFAPTKLATGGRTIALFNSYNQSLHSLSMAGDDVVTLMGDVEQVLDLVLYPKKDPSHLFVLVESTHSILSISLSSHEADFVVSVDYASSFSIDEEVGVMLVVNKRGEVNSFPISSLNGQTQVLTPHTITRFDSSTSISSIHAIPSYSTSKTTKRIVMADLNSGDFHFLSHNGPLSSTLKFSNPDHLSPLWPTSLSSHRDPSTNETHFYATEFLGKIYKLYPSSSREGSFEIEVILDRSDFGISQILRDRIATLSPETIYLKLDGQ